MKEVEAGMGRGGWGAFLRYYWQILSVNRFRRLTPKAPLPKKHTAIKRGPEEGEKKKEGEKKSGKTDSGD